MINPINPAVWLQVKKMYCHLYKTDEIIQKLFETLGFDKSERFKLEDLELELLKLKPEEQIRIILDVLNLEEFWLREYDIESINKSLIDRNNFFKIGTMSFAHSLKPEPEKYVPPEHRYWGKELVKLLKNTSNFLYDRATKTYSIGTTDGIHVISNIKNRKPLIEEKFNDYFYSNLNDEINGTFISGYYNATLFLIRKLFENFIIEVLEDKFRKDKIEYFDPSKNRYKDFAVLIDFLESKKGDFYDPHKTLGRFFTKLRKIPNDSNPFVHRKTYTATKEEVEKLNPKELIELYKHFCEDNLKTKLFK